MNILIILAIVIFFIVILGTLLYLYRRNLKAIVPIISSLIAISSIILVTFFVNIPSPSLTRDIGSTFPFLATGLFGLIAVILSVLQTIIVWEDIPLVRRLLKLPPKSASQPTTTGSEQQASTEQQTEAAEKTDLDTYVEGYRQALLNDPYIARFQILSMSYPLEVDDIYVRVRLLEEPGVRYTLEPELLLAEQQHDPNRIRQSRESVYEKSYSRATEPEKIIATFKRCVIVGNPGAGKTTLLKVLALRSARGDISDLPDLPIHVPLGAFASSGMQDIIEYAACQWDTYYNFPQNLAHGYIQERLETGNVLLLCDALDETLVGQMKEEAESSYIRVLEAISQIAMRYPRVPIVVTTRKLNYQQRQNLRSFSELEIVCFRTEDIEQFIEHWFARSTSPYQKQDAASLKALLKHNHNLHELASNPLLLTLLVLVFGAGLDLPGRRVELYRQCIDTLLRRWDASRDIRRYRRIKSDDVLYLLQEIAWHFHTRKQIYVSEEELLEVIENFLPTVSLQARDSRDVLQEIAENYGLLTKQANGLYSFPHLTFQEYFASEYAVSHNELKHLLALRRESESWWEEVIALYAGRAYDASELLQSLLFREEEPLLFEEDRKSEKEKEEDLILAGLCIEDRPRIINLKLRDFIIDRLLETLRTTQETQTQERVAAILAQIAASLAQVGEGKLESTLFDLLLDRERDLNLRKCTAYAMIQTGNEDYLSEFDTLLQENRLDGTLHTVVQQALNA